MNQRTDTPSQAETTPVPASDPATPAPAPTAAPTTAATPPPSAAPAPDPSSAVTAAPLSIVVPFYNEEACVPQLIQAVTTFCDQAGYDYELILIDDGSRDATPDLLRQAATAHPRIRAIILQRNYGQTAAMSAGIDAARHPLIITMDGDLQNDPRDIPILLAPLAQGYDVVSGWRKNRKDRLINRKLPSILANRLIGKVTGVRLHDYGCSLKLYRASILKQVRLYGDLHRFIPALCAVHGARVTEVAVSHHPRTTGTSKYGLGRTFRVILDLLTVKLLLSYGTRPLHFFGGAAAIFLGLALASFAVVIIMKFGHPPISINRNPIFYFTVLMGIAAVQMISIGLLAELVIRTYFESQQKPVYTTREVVSSNTDTSANTASTGTPQ